MTVTLLNRKQLSQILRHADTGNVRKAISRGKLTENDQGLIDIHSEKNRNWIILQIKSARKKGFIIDVDLYQKADNETKNNDTEDIDTELKRARRDLVLEQTKTAQFNRELSLGNYIRTEHMTEAVKVYLDQMVNIANTNVTSVASRFCKANNITSHETIIRLKSELTSALNNAIDEGRKEVKKCLDRMVDEQVEKWIK